MANNWYFTAVFYDPITSMKYAMMSELKNGTFHLNTYKFYFVSHNKESGYTTKSSASPFYYMYKRGM